MILQQEAHIESPVIREQDELIVRNNSSCRVFVRVYEQAPRAEGFLSWLTSFVANTYVPRSDIIEITAYDEQKFAIENAKTLRWVYYTEAENAEQALQLLTDTGPAISIRTQHVGDIRPDSVMREKIVIPEFMSKVLFNERAHMLSRNDKKMSDKVMKIRKENEFKQKQIDEQQNMTAQVVIATDVSGDIALSSCEEMFSKERDLICQSSMRGLVSTMDVELPADATFQRLSLSGSGGGFRAMLAFHGFQAGLQQEGLLDMISYVCGTSGSTWAMGDILANGGNPAILENLPQRMEDPLRRGIFSVMDYNTVKKLYKKMLAEGPEVGNERGYNGLLIGWKGRLSVTALAGVAPKNPDDEDIRLKPLYEHKPNPRVLPLPIFNVIASTELFKYDKTTLVNQVNTDIFKKIHRWDHVEITPFDTTLSPDQADRGKAEFPAWRIETRCLGRRFNDSGVGLVEDSPVPLSLASTIAIAGSALTVDWQKMCHESVPIMAIAAVTTLVGHRVGVDLNSNPDLRMLPAGQHQLSLDPENPTEEPQAGLIPGFFTTRPVSGRGGNVMVLRDAGFHYNLQMFQVMRSARRCGIGIAFDASSDLNEKPGDALFNAILDASSLQRKVSKELTNRELFDEKVQYAISNHQFPIVFGDPEDPEEFCVVYIPCVKTGLRNAFFDSPRWSNYDPMTIDIAKLNYEPEEAQMLHGYGKRLGLYVSSKIKEIVAQRIQAINNLHAPSDTKYKPN